MTASPARTMMTVPLLDLKAQYAEIRKDIDEAIRRVMESQRFIGGPEVTSLEEDVARYSRCAHAVGVASGTDALLLSLRALGVGPGDEVVTSAYSFFASATARRRCSWTSTRGPTTSTPTGSRRRSRRAPKR